MRSSALLLATLALAVTKASADTSMNKALVASVAKKDKAKENAKAAADVFQPAAPKRDLAGPTPIPKFVAPLVGAIVGAGALAGVVAMSVMKFTTPAPLGPLPPAVPAMKAKNLRLTGVPPIAAKAAGGGSNKTKGADELSSGLTLVQVIGVFIVLLMVVICIFCLCQAFSKKKRSKKRPTREENRGTNMVPEEQQPLNQGTKVDLQVTRDLPPIAGESTYMPAGGMESQYMPYSGAGSVATMQNVVPMQTMPPPRLGTAMAGASVYAPAQSTYTPAQSVYAPAQSAYAPASVYAPASTYAQAASPLAATLNTMPSMPATFYG